jgi:hypothetical protein
VGTRRRSPARVERAAASVSKAVSPPESIATRGLSLVAAKADHVQAVRELVHLSEGRREPLEAARAELVARLHADAADYDATKALQLVNAALSLVGWPTGTDT